MADFFFYFFLINLYELKNYVLIFVIAWLHHTLLFVLAFSDCVDLIVAAAAAEWKR